MNLSGRIRLSFLSEVCVAAIGLAGCSLYMESHRPSSVDLQQFPNGMPRDEVVSQLGAPKSRSVKNDNISCDSYDLNTHGVSNAGKERIEMLEETADLLTYGTAEIVSAPIEAATPNKLFAINFCYRDSKLFSVKENDQAAGPLSLPSLPAELSAAQTTASRPEIDTTGGQPVANVTPAASHTKVASAQSSVVQVVIVDQRASKYPDDHMKEHYGMDVAQMEADNDLEMLRSAIESELRTRGYKVGAPGSTVTATLSKFEKHSVNGWSITITGELVMNIVVTRPDKSNVYKKLIDARSVNAGIQIVSNADTQIALDRAVQTAVAKLFEDDAFLVALSPGVKLGTETASAVDTPPAAVHK